MTQRIDPVGPRRDLAPLEQLRMLTPIEREQEKQRRERERRRRARQDGTPAREDGAEPGGLDVRA